MQSKQRTNPNSTIYTCTLYSACSTMFFTCNSSLTIQHQQQACLLLALTPLALTLRLSPSLSLPLSRSMLNLLKNCPTLSTTILHFLAFNWVIVLVIRMPSLAIGLRTHIATPNWTHFPALPRSHYFLTRHSTSTSTLQLSHFSYLPSLSAVLCCLCICHFLALYFPKKQSPLLLTHPVIPRNVKHIFFQYLNSLSVLYASERLEALVGPIGVGLTCPVDLNRFLIINLKIPCLWHLEGPLASGRKFRVASTASTLI